MCPESVNILAIVLGTIIGIVVIGLILLLIWRLFTTIHDRREFAKFEKETQNAKFDTVCCLCCYDNVIMFVIFWLIRIHTSDKVTV